MAEITFESFGKTKDGREVTRCILSAGEYTAKVLTLGGILQSFQVPAPEGKRDIVLGCETPIQYQEQTNYLGAIIGRVANRISQASFVLNGNTYPLAANNGTNCLHGGRRGKGFDSVLWDAEEQDGNLVLHYSSADGEEGFPGRLEVQVTYSLSAYGALTLNYQAESDKDTLCNLTNHSYFNLRGHKFGSLEGHRLQIDAEEATEIDDTGAPNGRIFSVEGTPFDLQEPADITVQLEKSHPQLELGGGFDHNFILGREQQNPLQLAAKAWADGLCLECLTTQPGVQLYTANFLEQTPGKQGAHYDRRAAFCLETQGWPDAIHHPDFPSAVLKAGEKYQQTTVYRVVAEK